VRKEKRIRGGGKQGAAEAAAGAWGQTLGHNTA
jgi:hypothetical protein